MSLSFLNGIGASRRAARIEKKTEKVQAKTKLQQARQERIKKLVMNSPQVKLLKAIAKQSPVAAAKIKKAAVQAKQRRAFKNAGEPLKVTPETLQAEKTYELPVKVEEGTQEVNEPEFNDETTGGENDPETMEDLGIIYPEMAGTKKESRKSKKASKKQANAPKREARKEVAKKAGAAVLSVAKATLEAKGIKFPTKEQVQEEAKNIQPEAPKTNYLPYIIGGGDLLDFLVFKKK